MEWRWLLFCLPFSYSLLSLLYYSPAQQAWVVLFLSNLMISLCEKRIHADVRVRVHVRDIVFALCLLAAGSG